MSLVARLKRAGMKNFSLEESIIGGAEGGERRDLKCSALKNVAV